jgi:hypothetical protein
MFENDLKDSLLRIFDLKRATYQAPSESAEQEILFIEVSNSRNNIQEKRSTAIVTGTIRVYANADKLPFGYFSKRIASAKVEDVSKFFFADFEENTVRFQNIVERSLSFTYLWSSQYDPNLGTLNQLVIEEPEEAQEEPEV